MRILIILLLIWNRFLVSFESVSIANPDNCFWVEMLYLCKSLLRCPILIRDMLFCSRHCCCCLLLLLVVVATAAAVEDADQCKDYVILCLLKGRSDRKVTEEKLKVKIKMKKPRT